MCGLSMGDAASGCRFLKEASDVANEDGAGSAAALDLTARREGEGERNFNTPLPPPVSVGKPTDSGSTLRAGVN